MHATLSCVPPKFHEDLLWRRQRRYSNRGVSVSHVAIRKRADEQIPHDIVVSTQHQRLIEYALEEGEKVYPSSGPTYVIFLLVASARGIPKFGLSSKSGVPRAGAPPERRPARLNANDYIPLRIERLVKV